MATTSSDVLPIERQPVGDLLVKTRSVLLLAVQVIFVVAPLVIAWRLVDENRTDTLFLDDWSYVPLYEKAKLGQLTMHDLFGGYLEHRPAVIRTINIVLMLWSGGKTSWQCVVGLVAVSLSWINCGWLLRRALGGWTSMWLPWGLMGWLLFCPVQWQGFLWPSCMLVNLPLMYFTSALVLLGSTRMAWWVKFAGCVVAAWLATYTYTPGLILWVLIPVAAVLGPGMGDVKARRRFVLLWLVPMAVVIFSYFHNLENEVEPAFAYGQGKGDTATHSIAAVLQSPDRGLRFALILLGAGVARGLYGYRPDVAMWAGVVIAALLLLCLYGWIVMWRRTEVRRSTVPFLLVSGFALAVACMVAAGRAWASKDVGGALNNRYACYACTFIAGIVGMLPIMRKRDTQEPPGGPHKAADSFQRWISRLALPGTGLLCGLLLANWFYGAEMMQVWKYARLRGAVDVHYTPLLGQQQDRGRIPVQLNMAKERGATLNRLGLLRPPQAQTPSLDPFEKKGRLSKELGQITETYEKPDQIEVRGFALLTMRGRPPDAVLLTVRSDISPTPTIVDVCLPDVFPVFFLADNSKDDQFIFDAARPRRCGPWVGTVKRDQIPQGKAQIEVWALNFEKRTIREVGSGVAVKK